MSQVTITTKRHSGTFHLRSTNAIGMTIDTDGSPEIGGTDQGFRAMELLLASLASCSAIDVLLILKKQRQICTDIKIVVTADRVSIEKHSEFRNIHLHFELFGDIKEIKARKAIDLSLDSYCSVAQILKKSAEISYDFSIRINE